MKTDARGKFYLVAIKGEELRSPQVKCRGDMQDVETAMASLQRVLKGKALRSEMNVRPIHCGMPEDSSNHVSLQFSQGCLGDTPRIALI